MKNYIPYIIIVILAVFLFASFHECSRRGGVADANLNALTDTVQHYNNRLGTVTASKATLQLSNSQLKEAFINKDKELQQLAKEFDKVKSVVKFQMVTQFDTIQIAYRDTVPCVFERSGDIKDKWYSFGYRSNQKGVEIDSFKTWTSATAITGIKRKWFLGKETIKTDITLSNPNMTVTDITAAEAVMPSPWYKKWYIWLAAGAVGGFVISK